MAKCCCCCCCCCCVESWALFFPFEPTLVSTKNKRQTEGEEMEGRGARSRCLAFLLSGLIAYIRTYDIWRRAGVLVFVRCFIRVRS